MDMIGGKMESEVVQTAVHHVGVEGCHGDREEGSAAMVIGRGKGPDHGDCT